VSPKIQATRRVGLRVAAWWADRNFCWYGRCLAHLVGVGIRISKTALRLGRRYYSKSPLVRSSFSRVLCAIPVPLTPRIWKKRIFA